MAEDNKAAQYRQQAAHMRAEMTVARDAYARQLLGQMAETYEKLADWIERQHGKDRS